jgi:hypothetical protein
MKPHCGNVVFSCSFTDGGHFEKGKWVTLFSPFLDHIRELPTVEQTFEITGTVLISIFKQGAHIGDQKIFITPRIVTKAELEQIQAAIKEGCLKESAAKDVCSDWMEKRLKKDKPC